MANAQAARKRRVEVGEPEVQSKTKLRMSNKSKKRISVPKISLPKVEEGRATKPEFGEAHEDVEMKAKKKRKKKHSMTGASEDETGKQKVKSGRSVPEASKDGVEPEASTTQAQQLAELQTKKIKSGKKRMIEADPSAAEVEEIKSVGKEKRRKNADREEATTGDDIEQSSMRTKEATPTDNTRNMRDSMNVGNDTGKSKGKGKGKGKSNPAFRVFLKNLPRHIDESGLRRDFAECGELADVYLLRNKESGESRCLAYITFRDMNGVEAALKYHGDDYGGRRLTVLKAAEREDRSESANLADEKPVAVEKPSGVTSIVVKGLSPEVVKADLENFFADCGDGPTNVGLLMDKATGKSRCTARVDFGTQKGVADAMAMRGAIAVLKGFPFVMDYCKPRQW